MIITAETRLLGLIGWPVAHSLSPAMHNAAAAALKLDVAYVPLAVMPGRIEDALRGLAALGFLGANVTVPHKQAVMPYLETIDPAARAIGAVNTILVENNPDRQTRRLQGFTAEDTEGAEEGKGGRGWSIKRRSARSAVPESNESLIPGLQGFNTDWSGFLADLQAQGTRVEDRACLVLGAGGSARAVVYALAREGGRVTVYARRPAQAQRLVSDLQGHLEAALLRPAPWTALAEAREVGAPLIVNTTPVGMHPYEDASPWPRELPLPPKADIYDVIYNPEETQLMRRARAEGCRAYNGLGMLLQQGALAFEIWTGMKPALEVMATAVREQ